MTKLENLLKRFDEELGFRFDIEAPQDNILRNEVKKFLRSAIQEALEDVIGEEAKGEGSADEQQFSFGRVSGYNEKRQEVINKAKDWGLTK